MSSPDRAVQSLSNARMFKIDIIALTPSIWEAEAVTISPAETWTEQTIRLEFRQHCYKSRGKTNFWMYSVSIVWPPKLEWSWINIVSQVSLSIISLTSTKLQNPGIQNVRFMSNGEGKSMHTSTRPDSWMDWVPLYRKSASALLDSE